MPTYEYTCDAGHLTEHRQSINDDAVERCPLEGCEADARRRISAGVGVISGRKTASPAGEASGCGPSGFT